MQPALIETTVGQHFASIVSKFGDRPAYALLHQERTRHVLTVFSVISRHQQTQLSYDGLDISSNALARGLASIGVTKGDRVAVSLGNNIEFATVSHSRHGLWGTYAD